jgi:vacuolar protein sorting-associated protein 13A/C
MRLKPGSLDGLNLPIEVQFGYIGELRLTIPFSNLSKEPCVAEIDRIFMVARTKPDLADTADGIQFNNLPPAIMATLLADKLEKLLKHELEMFGNKVLFAFSLFNYLEGFQSRQLWWLQDGKQQEQDMTFAQRFAEKIIDNLQVHIGRVHIRYEYTPDMSNLQRSVPAFALGVIIDELSAFTTDANFQDVVFVVNQPQILKKIDLRQFAVYLQSDECVASQNPDFFDDVFETNVRFFLLV